mgnify:CR=1 FL=1
MKRLFKRSEGHRVFAVCECKLPNSRLLIQHCPNVQLHTMRWLRMRRRDLESYLRYSCSPSPRGGIPSVIRVIAKLFESAQIAVAGALYAVPQVCSSWNACVMNTQILHLCYTLNFLLSTNVSDLHACLQCCGRVLRLC